MDKNLRQQAVTALAQFQQECRILAENFLRRQGPFGPLKLIYLEQMSQIEIWPSLTTLSDTCFAQSRRLAMLIAKYGREAQLFHWTEELTADCPRKRAAEINDQCAAGCPDLPNVL